MRRAPMKPLLAASLVSTLLIFATKAVAETIYALSEEAADPFSMIVTVERSGDSEETRLVLRGANFGVSSQIEAPSCDEIALELLDDGEWQVPSGCRRVTWRFSLEDAMLADASAQQSIASRSPTRFVLISEASSLARLADAEQPELLQLQMERSGITTPVPNENGQIRLPAFSQAPLFLLMDAEPVLSRSDGTVSLAYFIDDPSQQTQLPDIDAHMRGLAWMSNLLPSTEPRTFQVVWLGVAADAPTVGGAAGAGLLLSNYRRAFGTPQRSQIEMYVPLHEAFHQIGGGLADRPPWVGESLGTYMASRALRYALDDAPEAVEVYNDFLSQAEQIPEGLLEISRQIGAGDRSLYDAFYSKGLAFWDAVDRAMRAEHGNAIETRLQAIVSNDFNIDGQLDSLGQALGIDPSDWDILVREYLGS